MATAPPPDYSDLFTPGSEPQKDQGSAPSAPPPAAAPYQAAPYPPHAQDQQPPSAPYPSQPTAPYPQPAAYPPQQPAAYPPQQPAAYPPPAPVGGQVPYQGYPAPTYTSQTQATTVVVNQQQAQQTIVHQKKDSPNHLLHCIICFFCPWYLCIWLLICCIYGC